jgi:hypothetical protein
MITRQEALASALRTATENMHARGEVQPMILSHAGDTLYVFDLGSMINSPVTKDIAADVIGSRMRSLGVTLYVVMAEGWYADIRNGDPYPGMHRPGQWVHPDPHTDRHHPGEIYTHPHMTYYF